MSLKISKSRLKKVINLQRRMRRENKLSDSPVYLDTSREFVSMMYRGLASDQRKRVKERKIGRLVSAARAAVVAYNERVSPPGSVSRGTKIHDFITPEMVSKKPAKVKSFLKVISKIPSSPRGKNLEIVKAAVKALIPVKRGKGGAEQSVSLASATAANKVRKAHGLLTINEEAYFTNFLKAALRVGAYKLFARARDAGIDYVSDLYQRGFSIPEVYASDDTQSEPPRFASDEELQGMGINIDNPDTFPTFESAMKLKQSGYGSELGRMTARLIRRRL